MIFSIKDGKALDNKHKYINNDGLIHNLTEICDCTIMLGCHYLGLDITSNTNRVCGVSGYVSIKKLPQEKVIKPKITGEGELCLENCIIEPNTAKDYSFPLKIKYDKKLNCICIGEDRQDLEAFKITNDLYVAVFKGKITAIFIFL